MTQPRRWRTLYLVTYRRTDRPEPRKRTFTTAPGARRYLARLAAQGITAEMFRASLGEWRPVDTPTDRPAVRHRERLTGVSGCKEMHGG